MSYILILIGLIIIEMIIIVKSFFNATESPYTSTRRPDLSKKPVEPVDNDKIIIIKNADFEKIKTGIQEFCNLNNENEYIALPRLIQDNEQLVIVFPYDIQFEYFCYLINYLKYFDETDKLPDIKAWCSTGSNEQEFVKEEIANKKVMIYIPDNDEDYEDVYITTLDNSGYIIKFSDEGIVESLENPVLNFEPFITDLGELRYKEYIDFE